jgi:hypothetical protein
LSVKWDAANWAVNLSALLKGKALEVYARLPSADALDYGKLREALLLRFESTEEGFRKRFRNRKPELGETFVQFSARLLNYFDRWVTLSKSEKTYESLLDLLIRDQLLGCCGHELRLFLKERTPKSVSGMASLADQFREARGGNILNVSYKPQQKITSETGVDKCEVHQTGC